MNMTAGPELAEEYFNFSATLRVHGENLPFAEIGRTLAIAPTHLHRKGEVPRNGRPWSDDAWHYSAPLAEEEPLTEHLRSLWAVVGPHVHYLRELHAKVDVFCGYRSNVDHAGFVVEPDALQIFQALNVPFVVSVVIT